MLMASTRFLDLDRTSAAQSVYGAREANLRLLADELTVDISTRGTRVSVTGDPLDVDIAIATLEQLYQLAISGQPIHGPDIVRAAEMIRSNPDRPIAAVFTDRILQHEGTVIAPKTPTQKLYVDMIRRQDVVFGIGPAGTGKTYLAVAMAVAALQKKQVRRIILTRPAVEAGERLGFLPGDMAEKVQPYLRPLYDSMQEMMPANRFAEYVANGIIEVAPLAFMRGRTLNDAFVILDEAQNTTRPQMKMFLTRLGFGSKAVITGDLSQIDLDRQTPSGLDQATRILSGVNGIGICHFKGSDVVRHPLVRRIIEAYDIDEAEDMERQAQRGGNQR